MQTPIQPRQHGTVRSAAPMVIGCACDSRYGEPTAAMLASVDANGDVAEASVLVAAFDLDAQSRALIKAGAGRLSQSLRFIDVNREMLREIDEGGFTDAYPVSVLGRLLIPNQIAVSHARLLTLDSDMIVNASLRPLFELDLGGTFFAAVHDSPRLDDMDYFNSGLTLLDVDEYKRREVAQQCLQWIARSPDHPRWPDQDALNAVVGKDWHRLDRQWNYFHFDDQFEPLGYERARAAHFAANPKPWDSDDHPGRDLYNRYLDIAKQARGASKRG